MVCDCFFRLILKVLKFIFKVFKCVLLWGFLKYIEDKINLLKEIYLVDILYVKG